VAVCALTCIYNSTVESNKPTKTPLNLWKTLKPLPAQGIIRYLHKVTIDNYHDKSPK